MKILFIIEAAFNPRGGGVQHTTYKLGKYFYENGLDVNYFSFSTQGHIESDYGALHNVNKPGGPGKTANINYLKSVLSSFKPDIIINQHPYTANIRNTIFDLQNELGYKVLGCLRNSLFSFKDNISFILRERFDGFLLKLLDNQVGLRLIHLYHYLKHRRDLKRILDKHDYFVLLAPPNQKDLEYFVGKYKTEKVKAIPNSIPEVFNYNPEEKENMLLYVGRLDVKQKRADLLAPLWEKLSKKIPNWKFVIVGDGPYKKTLDRELRELNLPSVETTGRQDPADYYRRASILIMPSAFEGFPNVLLEAQSHSVAPVLFNSYSSVPWVVEDGKDALLAEPFRVEEMANKVEYLANNIEVLHKMASAANTNAGRFTTEKIGNIWLDFFKELV